MAPTHRATPTREWSKSFVNPSFNLGSLDTSGIDFGLKYALKNTPIGGFNFEIGLDAYQQLHQHARARRGAPGNCGHLQRAIRQLHQEPRAWVDGRMELAWRRCVDHRALHRIGLVIHQSVGDSAPPQPERRIRRIRSDR